jgi:3-oxoadipate enol-lactonase
MNSESGYAPVKGGELYYEVAGNGRPMVLIHAGVSTCKMWDAQWQVFTKHYQVVRYDTRGFGKSRTEAVEFSNRQDLRDVMRHLDMSHAVIIGVSRSGQIAVDFTVESPDMVDVLIPVAAGLSGNWEFEPPKEEVALFEQMEALENAKEWDKVVEMDMRVWLAGPRRTKEDIDPALWKRASEINRVNYGRDEPQPTPIVLEGGAYSRLGEIDKPTLVIVGDNDVAGTIRGCELIAEGIPGAKKVVMHNTGHMPPMEHPNEFNQLVLDFLKSH